MDSQQSQHLLLKFSCLLPCTHYQFNTVMYHITYYIAQPGKTLHGFDMPACLSVRRLSNLLASIMVVIQSSYLSMPEHAQAVVREHDCCIAIQSSLGNTLHSTAY